MTRDFVNPEKPWPSIERLAAACAAAGKVLLPRLPVYPAYILQDGDRWLSAAPVRCQPRAAAQPDADAHPSGAAQASPVLEAGEQQSSSGLSALQDRKDERSILSRTLAMCDATGLARASTWHAGMVETAAASLPDTVAAAAPSGSADKGGAAPPQLQGSNAADVSPADAAAELARRAAAAQPGCASDAQQAPPRAPSAAGAGEQHSPAQQPRAPAARWAVRMSPLGTLQGAPAPDVSTDLQLLISRLQGLLDSCLAQPAEERTSSAAAHELASALDRNTVAGLLAARGPDAQAVCALADSVRAAMHGDRVSYVVNRNINYTNMCMYKCGFCAFSKGRVAEELRGAPYLLQCAPHSVIHVGVFVVQIQSFVLCSVNLLVDSSTSLVRVICEGMSQVIVPCKQY